MPRPAPILAWTCAALACALVVGAKLLGPPDLYRDDQAKTLTYTLDLIEHGRVALPRDVLFQPATKPPLYNLLAAPAVWLARGADPAALLLAHKWPSLLGFAVCAACAASAAARAGRERIGKGALVAAATVALFAGCGLDARHGAIARLLYVARPDMLQAAFLSLGWLGANRALSGRGGPWLFWLGVGGAAVTKGPAALLLLAYALLAAWLCWGDARRVGRLKPWLGLPAACAPVGAWLLACWVEDAAHARTVLLGREIVERAAIGSPSGTGRGFGLGVAWFFTKFAPASVLALGAVMGATFLSKRRGDLSRHAERRRAPRPFARRALGGSFGACALWCAVLVVGFALPRGKRVMYLLPATVPAAALAAVALGDLARRARLSPATPALLALPVAVYAAAGQARGRFEPTYGGEAWDAHAVAFARDVRAVTRDPPLVIVRGIHPFWALLGVHHGSALTPADLRAARWVVMPEVPGVAPRALSGTVPLDFAHAEPLRRGRVALYDAGDLDERALRDAVRAVDDWGAWENPYRAPGTVWRGE